MPLLLDPSWGCFMCFREISNSDGDDDDESSEAEAAAPASNNINNDTSSTTATSLAFKLLTRYLKVDLGGALLGPLLGGPSSSSVCRRPFGGEGEEVSVPLCIGCGVVARKFAELYQLLDFVRLEADEVVREIHGVMVAAEEDKDLVLQYSHRRRVHNNKAVESYGGDLVIMSENLRKEVVQKCLSLCKRTMPRVVLPQLDTMNCLRARKAADGHHLLQHKTDTRIAETEINDFLEGNLGNRIKIELAISDPNLVTKVGLLPPPDDQIISLTKPQEDRNHSEGPEAVVIVGRAPTRRYEKLLNCNSCPKSFQSQAHLCYHKYTQHRASLFLKYKEPSLSSDQFKQTVDKLFEGLVIQQKMHDKGKYKCRFCNRFQCKSKILVQNHAIRTHMDQLVRRLAALQKKNMHEDEEDFKSVIPSSTRQRKGSRGRHHRKKIAKSFECNLCIPKSSKKPFQNSSHWWYHRCTKHRSTFFLKYRDPTKLTLEQFEKQVLVKLFQGLDLPKMPSGNYSCCFCQRSSASCRIQVENHVIRKHMRELVPRLMGLQLILQQRPPEDSREEEVISNAEEQELQQQRQSTIFLGLDRDHDDDDHSKHEQKIIPSSSSKLFNFNCNHCTKSFKYKNSLVAHNYLSHRSASFAKYQLPNLTTAQFEQVLVSLFRSFDVPQASNNGGYKCEFGKCAQKIMLRRKSGIERHFIVRHRDELVLRLMKLQHDKSTLDTNARSHSPPPPPKIPKSPSVPKRRTSPAPAPPGLPVQNKCQYCNMDFRHKETIREHVMAQHRSTYFTDFKEPQLSSEQFERLIDEQLFQQIFEVSQQPDGRVKCLFCEPSIQRSCSNKMKLYSHFVDKHFDELVSRLRKLQANYFFQPEKEEEQEVVSSSFISCTFCSEMFACPSDVQCHAYMAHGSQVLSDWWRRPQISAEEFDELVRKLLLTELRIRQGRKGGYKCSFCHEFQSPNSKPQVICHILSSHRNQVLEILDKLQNDDANATPHQYRLPGSTISSVFQNNSKDLQRNMMQKPDLLLVSKTNNSPSSVHVNNKCRGKEEEKQNNINNPPITDDNPSPQPIMTYHLAASEPTHHNNISPCVDNKDDEVMVGIDEDVGPTAPTEPKCVIKSVKSSGVSYTKLHNGRYQCSVCHKTVKRNSRWTHKTSHWDSIIAGKSFKCHLCSKSFRRHSTLLNHKHWKHRSTFFAKHKDPKLTSPQFERVLEKLFDSIEVPKLRNQEYSCIFCKSFRIMKCRRWVHNHFIRRHMDQLVPRLKMLQGSVVGTTRTTNVTRRGEEFIITPDVTTEDPLLETAFEGVDAVPHHQPNPISFPSHPASASVSQVQAKREMETLKRDQGGLDGKQTPSTARCNPNGANPSMSVANLDDIGLD